ncbi:hypothetical protein JG687_00003265 [Phytophthora cactorum]|uniref:Serine aminopeptidase S33 domain-containing protein n=1 Tax=Phytophthora cactorum TaxID=29920 RepID=A0A8T1US10_9STRA|nr:hypothetical protein JG687_00003265 [Phytophthora cactorum]
MPNCRKLPQSAGSNSRVLAMSVIEEEPAHMRESRLGEQEKHPEDIKPSSGSFLEEIDGRTRPSASSSASTAPSSVDEREGFGVITYDLLNHGVSDLDQHKTRAHVSNFSHLVDDTNDFITFAKRSIYTDALRYWRRHHMFAQPELPLIIAGTSFGSLVGIHTVLAGEHKFHAAVWGSPTVGVTWNPLLWAESKLAKPLAAIIPTAKVVPAVQHDLLCRDPKFLRRFKADPLTSMDMMTTRTGHESLQAMIQLQEDKRVTDPSSSFCAVPTLFLAGSADGISDQQAAIKFFGSMGNFDKEFKLFDGLFHMVYEEPEKEEVFRYLGKWLHRRFPVESRQASSDSTSSKKKMKSSSRPRHYEGKFQNRRGQSLLYFSLFPPEKLAMRGIILHLHGMGDHCRRNTALYERYCQEGFGVITYDLVNHGASDYDKYNTRAHISNFDDFVEDTNDFVKFAKTNIYKVALRYWRKHHHPRHPHGREKKRESPPELPLIITGTSFGALIGLHTVLSGEHKFHAAVWASPSIGVTWTPVLWAQWKFAKPLVAAFPTAKMIPAIQHNLRSRNPEFLQKYQEDPLTSSDMITPRSGHQSLNAMIRLQQDKRVSDSDTPFCAIPMLFLAGSEDRISDQQASFKFFSRMGNLDKAFKLFDGLYHMIYEEPEKEDVLKYLVDWLHKRFPLETRHPNDSHLNMMKKLEPSIRSYNYVKAERTEL